MRGAYGQSPYQDSGSQRFDLSIILILRGRIIRYIVDFPEVLSQQFLVGRLLVGRLGVLSLYVRCKQWDPNPRDKSLIRKKTSTLCKGFPSESKELFVRIRVTLFAAGTLPASGHAACGRAAQP